MENMKSDETKSVENSSPDVENNPPDVNEVKSRIEKASRKAGLLTIVGVAAVVGALVFSFYLLNDLDRKIDKKKQELAELEEKRKESENALNETQRIYGNIQDIVKTKCPDAANEAIEQTVQNDPQANQVILAVTSKNSSPGSVPPPPNASVGFIGRNNVLVREQPSRESKALDRLRKGQTIYIMGYAGETTVWQDLKGNWAHIQTENGLQGYVFGPLLAEEKAPGPVKPEIVKPVLREAAPK